MADPRFFQRAGPFTLAELAKAIGAETGPGDDPDYRVEDVSPLDTAQPGQISFLDNRKYVEAFRASRAGACVVGPDDADKAPKGMNLLILREPYVGYAKIAQMFYPSTIPSPGVHPRAWVEPTAVLGEGCRVAAGAVIGANAQLGKRCDIQANAVIGDGVTMGDDCVIGPNATVTHAVLGSKVIIYPGAQIGQDGFGFAIGSSGFVKVPQLGRVIIHDDVEIGANSTVDRGAGPDTVIGTGCRIDNLVQVAHNVQLGAGCVLVSQSGVSGSTVLGNYVQVGGQVGITGHLKIGDGAKITGKSGIMRDVPPGATYAGIPGRPAKEHWRIVAAAERLAKKGEV